MWNGAAACRAAGGKCSGFSRLLYTISSGRRSRPTSAQICSSFCVFSQWTVIVTPISRARLFFLYFFAMSKGFGLHPTQSPFTYTLRSFSRAMRSAGQSSTLSMSGSPRMISFMTSLDDAREIEANIVSCLLIPTFLPSGECTQQI